MMFFVLFLGAIFGEACGQNYTAEYCRLLLTRDCSSFPAGNFCGTDGVTYRSLCELGQTYCRDNNVHQAHEGACSPGATPITANPTMGSTIAITTSSPPSGGGNFIHGSEIALDIFCLDINYITCPTGGTRVCATNGKWYENMCEFDKGRCYHRNIHSDGTNCQ